jgi:hypothetical protein
MTCRIDHITVVAASLETGRAWVSERLGVDPREGGKHPRMGTHNLLLRLGDAVFLEVIAVDPEAANPPRPRWFALDRLASDAQPRLACWVARADDIGESLSRSPEDLGVAEPMSRGTLEWLISIPEDGALPMGGVAPGLIQWHSETHPAAGMQDQGCRLVALELLHPEPDRVRRLVDALDVAEPGVSLTIAKGQAPALVAQISGPRGLCTIGAPKRR